MLPRATVANCTGTRIVSGALSFDEAYERQIVETKVAKGGEEISVVMADVRLDDIRSIERAKELLVQLKAFNEDRGFSKKGSRLTMIPTQVGSEDYGPGPSLWLQAPHRE
jgi:hypothetical protein